MTDDSLVSSQFPKCVVFSRHPSLTDLAHVDRSSDLCVPLLEPDEVHPAHLRAFSQLCVFHRSFRTSRLTDALSQTISRRLRSTASGRTLARRRARFVTRFSHPRAKD